LFAILRPATRAAPMPLAACLRECGLHRAPGEDTYCNGWRGAFAISSGAPLLALPACVRVVGRHEARTPRSYRLGLASAPRSYRLHLTMGKMLALAQWRAAKAPRLCCLFSSCGCCRGGVHAHRASRETPTQTNGGLRRGFHCSYAERLLNVERGLVRGARRRQSIGLEMAGGGGGDRRERRRDLRRAGSRKISRFMLPSPLRSWAKGVGGLLNEIGVSGMDRAWYRLVVAGVKSCCCLATHYLVPHRGGCAPYILLPRLVRRSAGRRHWRTHVFAGGITQQTGSLPRIAHLLRSAPAPELRAGEGTGGQMKAGGWLSLPLRAGHWPHLAHWLAAFGLGKSGRAQPRGRYLLCCLYLEKRSIVASAAWRFLLFFSPAAFLGGGRLKYRAPAAALVHCGRNRRLRLLEGGLLCQRSATFASGGGYGAA